MKLTCNVNQNEALLRGHEPNSTVVLDFPVADLTEAQRETLAAHHREGRLNGGVPLLEPTFEGLLHALARLAEKDEEDRRHQQAFEAELRAGVRKQFEDRKTWSRLTKVYAVGDPEAPEFLQSCPNRAEPFGFSSWEAHLPTLKTGCPSSIEKEESRTILASPEGEAWLAQVEAENDRRRAEAEVAAAAALAKSVRIKREEDERFERAQAYLGEIVEACGTPMQKERRRRGVLDWPAEALELLADDMIDNPDDLEVAPRALLEEGGDADVITDDDMALILRYEDNRRGITARIVEFEEEPEYGEAGTRRLLHVETQAPHGILVQRRFFFC